MNGTGLMGIPKRSWRVHLRRTAVALAGALWFLLASPVPESLRGWGIAVVLTIVTIVVALGAGTGWIAFRRRDRLDEFSRGLRDRAYRLAFRLFVLGVVLLGLALVVRAGLHGAVTWAVPDPVGARGMAALLVLLLTLPTAMAAWIAPTAEDDSWADGSQARAGGIAWRWLPLLSVPAVFTVWLLGVALLPVSGATVVTLPDPGFAMGSGHCGAFAATEQVARGFGPTVRLLAQVCWNGREAWVINDPGAPTPRYFGPVSQGVEPTLCTPSNDGTDFGVVTRVGCEVWVNRAGTVHVRLGAQAESGLLSIGRKWIEITLVVTRTGRVLTFT
ncbi:MAG: hypothetical protein M0027_06335 [Candidatus Dormibacteraeota bacterium]|nr:hypothetical protein [Candidatus Dormibacteraeota bacterium]